jgi:hypothetical protein
VSSQHLIVITRREQVASIRSKAIYAVRDVTLIPLTSQSDAEQRIKTARQRLNNAQGTAAGTETEDSEVEDEAETASIASATDEEASKDAAALEPPKKKESFAKNVIQKQGKYGRFAQRWFSRNGSKKDVMSKQGVDTEAEAPPKDPQQPIEADKPADITDTEASNAGQADSMTDDASAVESRDNPDRTKDKKAIEYLTPRILRSTRLYFNTVGFYFSYDHDISGALTQKSVLTSDLPLWKRFDNLVGHVSVR